MKKVFSNLDSGSILSMKSLYSLINNHFFKSIINPFFSFLFPIIFVAILGLLLGYSALLGGLIAIPSMTISVLVLPYTIFEFKNSVLLKRIAVTNIKPWMFLFVMVSYYFLIIIISTILTIVLSMGLFAQYWTVGKEIASSQIPLPPEAGGGTVEHVVLAPSLSEYFATASWGGIIWGIILNSLVGSSIGFLVVSFAKSSLILQGILIPILILSQFLSAMVLPIAMIKSIDAIWFISYISPFRYSTNLINESFNSLMNIPSLPNNPSDWEIIDGKVITQTFLTSSSIFNVDQIFSVLDTSPSGQPGTILDVFTKADKILNQIMPFILSIIFIGISLKTFKWSTR